MPTTNQHGTHQLAAADLTCHRADRMLFEKLSFTVNSGDLLQVTGANGAGKTSLLQILCGLMMPTEGEVLWQGEQMGFHYRQALHYIGHKNGVKQGLTPLENLRVACALHYKSVDLDLEGALSKVGLQRETNNLCSRLSVGQRQRVALARLLVTPACLWIVDEPFTAIDQSGIEQIKQMMVAHTQAGGMVVFTAHQSITFDESDTREVAL